MYVCDWHIQISLFVCPPLQIVILQLFNLIKMRFNNQTTSFEERH